jgi:hypothetical protein
MRWQLCKQQNVRIAHSILRQCVIKRLRHELLERHDENCDKSDIRYPYNDDKSPSDLVERVDVRISVGHLRRWNFLQFASFVRVGFSPAGEASSHSAVDRFTNCRKSCHVVVVYFDSRTNLPQRQLVIRSGVL